MRHACLRAMASIISWPTVFGTEQIIRKRGRFLLVASLFNCTFLAWSASARLHHGTQNLLEPGACYLETRSRFIKNLVHSLRNEIDSTNLQLTLGRRRLHKHD